ncbi:hypothetical protein AVEN_220928-1 [Araneus ventricosus]|uniref:Uncharacterized protein n=1 Tax=Araneus ventricosus TaxID=182803 RepID=A0A4Y2ESV9_ARAVE|nr:hypothetical protein AVEN_33289-1 [Araneus ventricosus]GBM31004.1 hypothetical protein AVEN_51046-1 [Araneus ventricosus]GBM31028.1 hypothetical protein AVEN_188313-1 [Araneus ventricosus]GBM31037.1 hypothetical protein AVEN_220928-1 [Araneus ventricosus]
MDNSWPWKILVGQGALNPLDGVVNTQMCPIWCTASPNVVHEQSLHLDCITVCCGFTVDFILRPFFLENTPYGPQMCSITGTRYCDFLQ